MEIELGRRRVTPAMEILLRLDLLASPRRVLIVEDLVNWLDTLTQFVESQGHHVTPMIGVTEVTAEHVSGLGSDGQTLTLPVREIEAVFLDYNFAGGKHNGASFLKALRQVSKAPVMAMSSDRGLNTLLLSLGATSAMQKSALRGVLGN